jgi:integrase
LPRPRRDGTPTRAINKRKLSQAYVARQRPQPNPFLTWDTKADGLVLQIRPNDKRSFKFIYSIRGRVRWYSIGDATAWSLAEARDEARRLRVLVDKGHDPQADRKAETSAGTFAALVEKYFEEHAKRKNRSWEQARYLVDKHLLPRWGKLRPVTIVRAHVKALMRQIAAPVIANQTLAASAIFSWAIREEVGGVKLNPCSQIDRNKTTSRARVLSETELPKFWQALERAGLAGKALQLILLTGQRPGEVKALRSEHIIDGWWQMPGAPVPVLGWPGTKNGKDHRVWLPRPARALIAQLQPTGFLLPVDRLDAVMRRICAELGVTAKITPHDLRRSHGTKITGLGFGREAMNRIQNHVEGGIADVYDVHRYERENQRIMEEVADEILRIVEGRPAADNVVPLRA